MTVSELQERLRYFDPDAVVVVGAGQNWSRLTGMRGAQVDLGITVERVAWLQVEYLEQEPDPDCHECERLRDVISGAHNALESA